MTVLVDAAAALGAREPPPPPCTADSADVRRVLEGFVVYRETAQLMEALESSEIAED